MCGYLYIWTLCGVVQFEQVEMSALTSRPDVIPALHILAIALVYFFPYVDSFPQYFS